MILIVHASLGSVIIPSQFAETGALGEPKVLRSPVVNLGRPECIGMQWLGAPLKNFSFSVMDYYSGKVILVTGASSGLGLSIVDALLSTPRTRVVACSRSPTKIANLYGYQDNLRTVMLDLESSENDISNSINGAISLFGFIDVVINCAGVGFRGRVDETLGDVDRKIMQVDYFGQTAIIKCMLAEWKRLNQSSCHIIQIASVQGYFGLPERAPYSAAKHALVGFIDSLRAEVDDLTGESRIKVTLVSPGYIATNHSSNALTGDGSYYNKKDESNAAGYPPERVARTALEETANGKREVVIANSNVKLLIYIRHMFPTLSFRLIRNRYMSKAESFLISVMRWLFNFD
jgi:dehydrogenase/reductase SDR family protein 7B